MTLTTLLGGDPAGSGRGRAPVPSERPELMEWLANGRLTLVHPSREAVTPDEWPHLPAEVQAQALADFQRIVRGNTKAAVLFLRP